MKKVIVLCIIALFIGVGFQPVFAVNPIKSTDIAKEELEPKDYLFETIIEIANNPEVKELFEEYGHNIFNLNNNYNAIYKKILFKNPSLFFSLLFTKPKMTKGYLNFTYNKGSDIMNIIGEDEALEMIESIENSNFEILKNLNDIIMNNKETSNRITILSELNFLEPICLILFFLFLTSCAVATIFGYIWRLNMDSLIWTIIFYPPTAVSCILGLIMFYLWLEVFDCAPPWPYRIYMDGRHRK